MKKSFIIPKALELGDTIGIVTPAAPLPKELLELFRNELTALGFKVKFSSNSNSSYGYLAGCDEERAKAFMATWLDPEVNIVWCSRGGYGCARLLPFLDFNLLKERPKMFIGMSDVTALHSAMSKASLVSYLGPTLSCLFSLEKPKNDLMHESCWEFLSNPKEKLFDHPFEVIKEGSGQGRLVGGNLSLIASLVGTPWQLETKSKILVLEDVNEAPYRIDRMLNQLKQAGLLENLAGLVLGTFKDCGAREGVKTLSLSQIFNEYFSKRDYPCILGFPTGHIETQVILPLCSRVKIDTASKTLQLVGF